MPTVYNPASTPAAQPAPTPGQPAPAEPEQQKQDQPQYVTKEMLAEAVEQGVRRAQQSAADRTRNVENRVNALADQVGKFTQVTPEMKQAMREQAEKELDAAPAQSAPNSQPAEEPDQGNPVYDWTQAYFKEEGLTLDKNDPEWKGVKAALDDPGGSMVKYQRAVIKAIDAKRVRVSEQSNATDARVIGGGSSPGAPAANSARDYWQRAHTK